MTDVGRICSSCFWVSVYTDSDSAGGDYPQDAWYHGAVPGPQFHQPVVEEQNDAARQQHEAEYLD